MKTPKEKLIEFLERNVEREKDKWNNGMKNDYFAWCDLRDDIEDYLERGKR